MDIRERAKRYLDAAGPAISGAGGHTHTLMLARALVRGFSFSESEALSMLEEWNGGNAEKWTTKELLHKIHSAQNGPAPLQGDGYLCKGSEAVGPSKYGETAKAPTKSTAARPPINRDLLAEFTRGVPAIDEGWISRRSPLDVSSVTAGDFLSAIFSIDERVLVFTTQYSQGDFLWWVGRGGFRLSADRGIKAVASDLPKGGPEGVWYLVQPVTGQWAVKRHVKWDEDEDGKKSRTVKGAYTRRSEENVTAWRHFVLESDVLSTEEWLRVLAALDLAVVAIYTSGGRSIHAIVRIPVASKQIWDASRNVLRQVLCVLGADPAALSAVRLSRLPGCLRGNKMQKLLFLSPDADPKQKIHLMPELR